MEDPGAAETRARAGGSTPRRRRRAREVDLDASRRCGAVGVRARGAAGCEAESGARKYLDEPPPAAERTWKSTSARDENSRATTNAPLQKQPV